MSFLLDKYLACIFIYKKGDRQIDAQVVVLETCLLEVQVS